MKYVYTIIIAALLLLIGASQCLLAQESPSRYQVDRPWYVGLEGGTSFGQCTFRSQWGATPSVSGVTAYAKSAANVDYLTKGVTATGDAGAVSIPAASAHEGYALGFSGLQVPQKGVRKVTVTIAGKEYVYESAEDIPLASGKITTLGLIVGRETLELAAVNIADWTAGASLEDGEAAIAEP